MIEIIKYLISGGLAFLADICVLYLLTEYLKIHYFISVGIAFLCGLVIVYILNTKWVFRYRTHKNKKLEFLIFSLITLDGLCLNLILIPFFTEICGLYYMFSKVITTGLVLIWNYAARKYYLFNKRLEDR
ncbi:MAG: GtrA family protein [Candidatus Cloacimonetes bacterium]|nr:GtrA family protein [Candidatus Cloacimonadota bacterium]